jgi:hypothetical protein
MRNLKKSGITILLVSHSMLAIGGVCERSLYLDHGRIAAFGQTEQVIKEYRNSIRDREEQQQAVNKETDFGTDSANVKILSFEMFGEDDQDRRRFRFGESVRIRIRVQASRRIDAPLINFGIKRTDGVVACNFNHWYDNFKIDYLEGECVLEGWLPPLRLIPFDYAIHVLVWQRSSAYAEGDLDRLRPLAARIFGNFTMEGPPLTPDDGVFQEPASKWVFTRETGTVIYTEMDRNSLWDVYDLENQPAAQLG